MTYRKASRMFYGTVTMDGAGVRLIRILGRGEAELLDPFLLLDLFGSPREEEYLPGFPWHPHRGIETVTYMLAGSVRHGDSLGNSGRIGPGEVQWMTAGSGVIHEEMPQPSPGGLRGFQLWINLPASEKMRDPAYRGISAAELRALPFPWGELKPIAGSFGEARGPARGIPGDPAYAELRLLPGGRAELEAPADQTCFACVFEGSLAEPAASAGKDGEPVLLLFEAGRGEALSLAAGEAGCALMLARARPLGEKIAWRGPIVMNSEAELDLAFREYALGSFVKKGAGR